MTRLIRCVLLVVMLLLSTKLAEARIDRVSWLRLYDSPDSMAKGAAVLYVDGMANGLSIADAMDCTGIETAPNELAATVARIAREKNVELRVAVPVALVIHGCREVPGSVFEKSQRQR
jgi:hypothetical protein